MKTTPLIKTVPLDSISPDPANVRRHSSENIAAIKASLRRFGQQKPIVVDRNNIIRAGNGSYQAARELGWSSMDVLVTDLSGPDAIAYAIADNRTAELAEWDLAALKAEFNSLDDLLRDATGFSDESLEALLKAAGEAPLELAENSPLIDEIPKLYELAVECRDEADQEMLYQQLAGQGRKVRVMTL